MAEARRLQAQQACLVEHAAAGERHLIPWQCLQVAAVPAQKKATRAYQKACRPVSSGGRPQQQARRSSLTLTRHLRRVVCTSLAGGMCIRR